MKKIFIIILVLISAQSFGQLLKLYARKCNVNGTIDSFYTKPFGTQDSAFDKNGVFVQFTKEHFIGQYQPSYPNAFENYTQRADGIWENTNCIVNNATIVPVVTQSAIDLKANISHTHTINQISNASTVGQNLLGLSTPASTSFIGATAAGGAITRTTAQAITDLGIDLKANINSPAFTGTATGIGLPTYARVTGSNATTTGQDLVDITGLSVPLTTNAVYEFEVVLSVSTTAVTTGTQYGINYSAAGATIEANIVGSATSTTTKTERISVLNTATTAYLTTSAQSGGVRINGIITTGANAGNLTAKHLKVTSGTSTVFVNSFIKVTRIQ